MLGDKPWQPKPNRLSSDIFEQGRLKVAGLAAHHIKEGYTGKSARCRDCVYVDHCDGLHINQIRAWGLKVLQPQKNITQPLPTKQLRIKDGLPNRAVAPSLPGYAPPTAPPEDPLVILAEETKARKEARRAALLESIRKE